ncbi:MAG: antitoxin [Cyanobacteria bacterium K_DeepCast_35m_m1_288]|nr:antitoxin [Cyanobacteria bacterium K_DeepCast_35m_m1_288]
MAAISVRGLDASQLQDLKNEAQREGISLNRLVFQRLTGARNTGDRIHHDLDELIGTWTAEEADAFAAALAPLEQVDAELWD